MVDRLGSWDGFSAEATRIFRRCASLSFLSKPLEFMRWLAPQKDPTMISWMPYLLLASPAAEDQAPGLKPAISLQT